MNWIEMLILSVVQGITEFLPVSSSGHLFILEKLMGLQGDFLFFNVMLHLASLMAVVWLLWKDIIDMFRSKKTFLLVAITAIPAFIIGFLIKDWLSNVEEIFWLVGIGLLFTAGINFLIDKFDGNKVYENLSYKQSLYIGLIQAVAILPGISRSGSTILAGRLMNLKKENALKFAFLMSLPVISAASAYELLSFFKDGESLGMSFWYVLFGCLITFFVSYFTIKFFMRIIKKVPFKYFGIYSMIMGIIVIIIGIL